MSSQKKSARKGARKTPWERPVPRKVAKRPTKSLSTAQKNRAKARAKRAGRSYPNMVDNMHEASKSRPKKAGATKKRSTRAGATKKRSTRAGAGATKKRATRAGAKKRARSSSTDHPARGRRSTTLSSASRDPAGGLSAQGRAVYRAQGSHLKPGVKKNESDMSPTEMRRKGSWATRFYGRSGDLPALIDDRGRPTRFALTARAWGEPVPKTAAAARKIAAKGRRLLEKAKSKGASARG
jgi:hypothetical protein